MLDNIPGAPYIGSHPIYNSRKPLQDQRGAELARAIGGALMSARQ
jgi:hypothetical protein